MKYNDNGNIYSGGTTMKKIKLEVTTTEKVLVVVALKQYASSLGSLSDLEWCLQLANRLAEAEPAEDGPEVEILRGIKGL
jgi:hypothetical protein